MNKVFLIGNLTKNPELTNTGSGIPVCRFTLAVSRRFSNSDGVRDTDFLPVVVWRTQAEHCNDVRIPRKGTILQNPRKILLYLRATKKRTVETVRF